MIEPLSQKDRIPCSLPLVEADLNAGNANWTKGLQAMSDWIWSGNLTPEPFHNNLGRFLLWISGIFEQQLNYSTTLIFDEPSFKNGIQISGMLDRVSRELVISLIAQKRRSWYSMTHHAILGRLTANKHGLTEQEYINKWGNLADFDKNPAVYTRVERAVLSFAHAFCTDPKTYPDSQFAELRAALKEENVRRYPSEERWLEQLNAARSARAKGLLQKLEPRDIERFAHEAADAVSTTMPDDLNERKINGQIVELAFLCLQFVALTDVFTGLNIPDEDFLADIISKVVPAQVIKRINELNMLGPKGMEDLSPPKVMPPLKDIINGKLVVEPAPLKGSRIPLVSYEQTKDLDKGITFGGVQVGVYGWAFGIHFPGSLVFCLMHHPELARYEPPYSLPVLFNEDEWRNGVNTSGFVNRRLKEIIIQKIYKILRSRYGIEHHTMFFYNAFLDEYGVGRQRLPNMTPQEEQLARKMALERANTKCLWIHDQENAPAGVYSDLEKKVLSWTEKLLLIPHDAYKLEKDLRLELEKENRHEIASGTRLLDISSDRTEKDALNRLVNHQIAELAMMIGHMDGLGRALTILHIESEDPVQAVEGKIGHNGGIIPILDPDGQVKFTGYFNNRSGLLDILRQMGISDETLTVNELMVNPKLNEQVKQRLSDGEGSIHITKDAATRTGEF